MNQLVAEYNQAAGKSWKYEYDSGGNITKKTEYSNATASGDGTVIAYEYTDSQWGDLLTKYNGKTIDYDKSGNMAVVFDSLAYVWQGGRQLQKITDFFTTTISFEYNEAGLRTSKNDNGKVYNYTYQGSLLASDVTSSDALYFHYDANGSILGFTYVSGSTTAEYYYIKNLQGDVIGILDASGNQVVSYTYNAWGQVLSVGGSNTTLANRNPIRYRGYYYDSETSLYYLQSRYYNPEIGRFVNADTFVLTGGLDGSNMYAYCGNNPVINIDPKGHAFDVIFDAAAFLYSVYDAINNPDDELAKVSAIADGVSLVLPFVSGGGTIVRAGGKIDDLFDAFRITNNTVDATKGFKTFAALKDAIGSPGAGNHWHHIVEQCQIKRSGFVPELIQNPSNVVAIDATTHAKISGYYSSKQPFTDGKTVRDWLAGQSFETQYQFGLDIIAKYTGE